MTLGSLTSARAETPRSKPRTDTNASVEMRNRFMVGQLLLHWNPKWRTLLSSSPYPPCFCVSAVNPLLRRESLSLDHSPARTAQHVIERPVFGDVPGTLADDDHQLPFIVHHVGPFRNHDLIPASDQARRDLEKHLGMRVRRGVAPGTLLVSPPGQHF